ncbi:hypothetical protein [Tropicimonas sediminicola]|uniref:hypothetical protein n=1 Tax=Tropicimonas sediminicola TaxID=1031541 RepID=UPI001131A4B6|nr:hypothetical protein [Tropicimonas sediminicola]
MDEFQSRARRGAFIASGIVAIADPFIIPGTRWIHTDLHKQTRKALLNVLPVLFPLPFPRRSNALSGVFEAPPETLGRR